jgi:hypothetical protein
VAIPDAPPAVGSHPAGRDAQLLAKKRKPPAKKPKKTHSAGGQKEIRIEKFTVREAELEPILGQLAARLGLTLELDREAIRAAGIALDSRVSVSLTRVTPDELFEEILSPLGLRAKRQGTTIRIGPKP